MTRKLFGTDGMRGVANLEPMTGATVMRLGMAIAARLRQPGRHTRIAIGKDTRLSGYMFESALAAGIAPHRRGDERDAGRRQRAGQPHIGAHRDDAGGERRLEHVARQPGVLADRDPRVAAGLAQPRGDRHAEPHHGGAGHRLEVRDAANAVGAEQGTTVGHR